MPCYVDVPNAFQNLTRASCAAKTGFIETCDSLKNVLYAADAREAVPSDGVQDVFEIKSHPILIDEDIMFSDDVQDIFEIESHPILIDEDMDDLLETPLGTFKRRPALSP